MTIPDMRKKKKKIVLVSPPAIVSPDIPVTAKAEIHLLPKPIILPKVNVKEEPDSVSLRSWFKSNGGSSYSVYLYWSEFYSNGNDNCSLCGGSGVIDTSDKLYGRNNFCFCLEGQNMRKANKK